MKSKIVFSIFTFLIVAILAIATTGLFLKERGTELILRELQTAKQKADAAQKEKEAQNIEINVQLTNLTQQAKQLMAENGDLKNQIQKLSEQNEQLIAEKDKLQAASENAQLKKETEQNVGTFNMYMDKISAHLQRLLDEQQAFKYGSTASDEDQEVNRLKQLANSEKLQIEENIAELKGKGFTGSAYSDAEFYFDNVHVIDKLIKDYGYYVEYCRMSSDTWTPNQDSEDYKTVRGRRDGFKKCLDDGLELIQALKLPLSGERSPEAKSKLNDLGYYLLVNPQ